MTDPIIARIAALKNTSTPDLRALWRDLFESEPPRRNRRFLESRLGYRIQELAYGGLKPATLNAWRRWARRSTVATPISADDAPTTGPSPAPG